MKGLEILHEGGKVAPQQLGPKGQPGAMVRSACVLAAATLPVRTWSQGMKEAEVATANVPQMLKGAEKTPAKRKTWSKVWELMSLLPPLLLQPTPGRAHQGEGRQALMNSRQALICVGRNERLQSIE